MPHRERNESPTQKIKRDGPSIHNRNPSENGRICRMGNYNKKRKDGLRERSENGENVDKLGDVPGFPDERLAWRSWKRKSGARAIGKNAHEVDRRVECQNIFGAFVISYRPSDGSGVCPVHIRGVVPSPGKRRERKEKNKRIIDLFPTYDAYAKQNSRKEYRGMAADFEIRFDPVGFDLIWQKRMSMEMARKNSRKQKKNEPSCIGRSRGQIGHSNMASTHWKLQLFSFDLNGLYKPVGTSF